MGSKNDALLELEAVIKEFSLMPSRVGREIRGDPGFMSRMRDPSKTISTKTLDTVWRFIYKTRGQLDLNLD